MTGRRRDDAFGINLLPPHNPIGLHDNPFVNLYKGLPEKTICPELGIKPPNYTLLYPLMHLPSLSTTALVLLAAFSSVSQARPRSQYTDPISWEAAYSKAEALVKKMSLEQKVGLATGMGWEKTNCVGNTFASTDPDFPSLCLEDSPLGIRFGNNVTAGVSGINAAASFDKEQIRKRGEYIGEEAYGKGVHAILGPCVDVMRAPNAGRAWEAFGEDPYLAGIATMETVIGIQSRNVVRHRILY